MPVRIRLRRVGRKKQPSYRIVVAEGQSPRGGAYIDNVGYYNPLREPAELKIDLAKVDLWVGRGAQVTPTVQSLIKKARQGSPDVAPPKTEAAVAVETPEAEAAVEEAKSAKKPAAKKPAAKSKAKEAEAAEPTAEAAPEAAAEEPKAEAPVAEEPAAEEPAAEGEAEAAEESKE